MLRELGLSFVSWPRRTDWQDSITEIRPLVRTLLRRCEVYAVVAPAKL